MRKHTPFRWIEGAEARQVLTRALSEASAAETDAARNTTGLWSELRRRWLLAAAAPRPDIGVPADQPADDFAVTVQPAADC